MLQELYRGKKNRRPKVPSRTTSRKRRTKTSRILGFSGRFSVSGNFGYIRRCTTRLGSGSVCILLGLVNVSTWRLGRECPRYQSASDYRRFFRECLRL